ncbi:MAG: hypothetical protein JXA41_04090 [Deltaproteobacteria bacterium]|nr:hypothetical protein [Deltaproteobacteria bacterium]
MMSTLWAARSAVPYEGGSDDRDGNVMENKDKAIPLCPVLTIRPREIDLGAIYPGESREGRFILRNVGAGSLQWSTAGPSEWTDVTRRSLIGNLEADQKDLKLHFDCFDDVTSRNASTDKRFNVSLTLEFENQRVLFQKKIRAGAYRESIPLKSNGGTRTIFFRYKILGRETEPLILVEPLKIDFGVMDVDEKKMRRIELKNNGGEPLEWYAGLLNKRGGSSSDHKRKGRYISFLNSDIKGSGLYDVPESLKDDLEVTGLWEEHKGYPKAMTGGAIKYRFSGSGIKLNLRKNPGRGILRAYIDAKLITEIDCYADVDTGMEIWLAENMVNVSHTLALFNGGSQSVIQGVTIFGKDVETGIRGIVDIFPDSGVTTQETDYINITIDTKGLIPGWYAEDVIIKSTGGDVVVGISFEIADNKKMEILNVFRYVKDNQYIYVTQSHGDQTELASLGYQKEGVAFRLFQADTPGTACFYHWYHPQKKDHFYSYDQSGGEKSLDGYVLQGVIGNIATSRLTNTRELYRWYNPASGRHFYTTDQKGEGKGAKGYLFETIAGYVR